MKKINEKIIVALDVNSLDEIKRLIEAFAGEVKCFKVGLEAMTSMGAPAVVAAVKEMGAELFFDGKFHDIPNTVAEASRAAALLGVKMFNVHASSGRAAMSAAAAQKGKSILLAVTVLTSLDEESSRHIYGEESLSVVLKFANDAKESGADGIVCSPRELEALKAIPGLKSLTKVTPGIRPEWASSGDQKRTLTPAQALRAGADYLVIGRPLTSPPPQVGSSLAAFRRIIEELESVNP